MSFITEGGTLKIELFKLMKRADQYEISALHTAVQTVTKRYEATINCFEEYNGRVTLRVSAKSRFETTYDQTILWRRARIRLAA